MLLCVVSHCLIYKVHASLLTRANSLFIISQQAVVVKHHFQNFFQILNPLSSELVYYITLISLCQALFSWPMHLLRFRSRIQRPAEVSLISISKPTSIVKNYFSIFSGFFMCRLLPQNIASFPFYTSIYMYAMKPSLTSIPSEWPEPRHSRSGPAIGLVTL